MASSELPGGVSSTAAILQNCRRDARGGGAQQRQQQAEQRTVRPHGWHVVPAGRMPACLVCVCACTRMHVLPAMCRLGSASR